MKLSSVDPDDATRFRDMAPEDRLDLFLDLCDLTDSIVSSRSNEMALRSRHRRSPKSEAVWRHLMERARRVETAP